MRYKRTHERRSPARRGKNRLDRPLRQAPRSLYTPPEDTGPLIDTDPTGFTPPTTRVIRFPEEPPDVILGESLPPEPRPYLEPITKPLKPVVANRPSRGPLRVPTTRPKESGLANPRASFADGQATVIAPPPLPTRISRSISRVDPSPAKRARVLLWLAAWIFLIGVPAVALEFLIPGLWQPLTGP
ncbi:MAG: hypothetical protein AAGA48_08795 [Myxococcota bacterium]